jgi:hypothetical protein
MWGREQCGAASVGLRAWGCERASVGLRAWGRGRGAAWVGLRAWVQARAWVWLWLSVRDKGELFMISPASFNVGVSV